MLPRRREEDRRGNNNWKFITKKFSTNLWRMNNIINSKRKLFLKYKSLTGLILIMFLCFFVPIGFNNKDKKEIRSEGGC